MRDERWCGVSRSDQSDPLSMRTRFVRVSLPCDPVQKRGGLAVLPTYKPRRTTAMIGVKTRPVFESI